MIGQGAMTIGALQMRWLAAFLGLLAALAAGGCTTSLEPTQAELKASWDAQNVYPQNYKSDLLAFLRTYLNDPNQVRDAALAPPQLKPVGPGDRYLACLRYNARNSRGQYAGAKEAAVVYVSGKLDRFLDGATREAAKNIKEVCQDAAYAPFPELERLKR